MKDRRASQSNQFLNLNVIFSAATTCLQKLCLERESVESTQIRFACNSRIVHYFISFSSEPCAVDRTSSLFDNEINLSASSYPACSGLRTQTLAS